MKKCEEISGQIWPFLLQEIDPLQVGAVEGHLQECVSCKKEYEGAVQLLSQLNAVSQPEPSELFFARQANQIQQKIQNEKSDWFHFNPRWRPALAAAAVLAVFWVGGSLFQSLQYSTPTSVSDQANREKINPPSQINIERLNAEQLNQITEQLEKIVFQKLPVIEFFGDSGDVDDLNDQELDHLIQDLETTEFRRNS